MRALLAATLAAVVLVWAAVAQAQMRGACLPHDDAVAKLNQHYGEQPVGLGLGPTGKAMFELFVAETGTWTLLMTRTNGISCITASGNGWEISPLRQGDPS
jgi:hypothetical protein